MRQISVTRDITAPQSAVWAVLADFPNISEWNGGVKASRSTSNSTEGLGARRHCDLAPAGALDETIIGWEPESQMVIRIDKAAKIPVKTGEVTFDLVERESAVTPTTITYAYEPKFGAVGNLLLGRFLDKQLTSGFGGFLEDLEKAALTR